MSFEVEKMQIQNNISLWKQIDYLNKEYSDCNFDTIQSTEIIRYEKRTSKEKYGREGNFGIVWGCKFDFISFLSGKIFEEIDKYTLMINKYGEKYELYDEYRQNVLNIFQQKRLYKDFASAPQDRRGVFARWFGPSSYDIFLELQKYENEMLNKRTYTPSFPKVILHLSATTQYYGYSRDVNYSFRDIMKCYELAVAKKGKMGFVQQQRAIINDNIRYEVLKRDGFRCRICGATAQDGVRLEVDHIIPVSKGGKSIMENLQTLCERCNKGKGNKM